MLRRTGGELATMDLIFVFLIAEATSPAMGDFTSVADGILLIVILMTWNYLVNFLSYHPPNKFPTKHLSSDRFRPI